MSCRLPWLSTRSFRSRDGRLQASFFARVGVFFPPSLVARKGRRWEGFVPDALSAGGFLAPEGTTGSCYSSPYCLRLRIRLSVFNSEMRHSSTFLELHPATPLWELLGFENLLALLPLRTN